MTSQADRIETLIRNRIEHNRYERSDMLRLAGTRFRPLQLAAPRRRWAGITSASVGPWANCWHTMTGSSCRTLSCVAQARCGPGGLHARLHLLHSGQSSRVELLFRLRYGPRAKQHRTVVKGLVRAFAIERLCRLPVVGVMPDTSGLCSICPHAARPGAVEGPDRHAEE